MSRCQRKDGRQPFLPYTILLYILLALARASAQDANICDSAITVDGVQYDLQKLAGPRSAKYTENTPPSQNEHVVTFDLCKDLEKTSVPDSDQCPTGTRVCYTKINKKEGENDRIVEVVPVAQSSALDPMYSQLNALEALSIHLHNRQFSVEGKTSPQMFNLTLICNNDASDPSFLSYQNGTVTVEWKTPAGCKTSETKKPDEGSAPESSTGSGISWFFILLLLCFFGYFAIGAYYNYNHFGASGWDLIPHRDFWREVPYLFRDFIDHLCATFRPGYQSSRRGYVAV